MTLKLLVLGGTKFLGRHIVEAAHAAGHDVTVFHRGRTAADLPPGVERLIGDRRNSLSSFAGRRFDSVIDTSGYQPGVVRRSAEALRDVAVHYMFVSSVSVYSDFSVPGMDENGPLGAIDDAAAAEAEAVDPGDPVTADAFGDRYGPLKVRCEHSVLDVFGDRAAIVRPGLIVGRWDITDRFGYWVRRVAEGGEVLAPGKPGRPVQLVDAADLAAWMVRLAAGRASGVFNATGPATPTTLGEVLEACRVASGSDARWVWIDEAFLAGAGVSPWGEMPLWLPGEAYAGFMSVGIARALAAGLRFRPLTDTVHDALAWERSRPPDVVRQNGLDRTKERAVLAAWAAIRAEA